MLNKSGLHIWVSVPDNEHSGTNYSQRSYCSNEGCECIKVKNNESGFFEYYCDGKKTDIQPICKGKHEVKHRL